ncbi:MAG: FecR family protein [Bacteroidaceae bacterium]
MDEKLLHRFFAGNASFQEEQVIRQWMDGSVENHQKMIKERKLFDAILLLGDQSVVNKQPHLFTLLRMSRWPNELLKIAAVILITITGLLTYQSAMKSELHVMQKIHVPAGQRVNLQLADGTVVWLNSRSTLEYPSVFNKKNRLVKLEGEAYFEVSHNKKKPFIVSTHQGRIEVLGTKFNLRAYLNDEFTTSLLEGSVKVHVGSQNLLLKPSQMAYLSGGRLQSAPIVDYNEYRWKEGLICFKNQTFAAIIKRFEICYGVTIEINNEAIKDIRYTGKFRQTDGVYYALRVLQKDLNFSYFKDKDEENNIIYIK